MKNSIYISLFSLILQSFCFLLSGSSENRDISDLRACADPKCSVPISSGVAQISYATNLKRGVSFTRGNEVTVYSKSAGKRKDLWGVEVNGKQGYAPKNLITERKVFVKDPEHIVPTEPFMKDELEIPVEVNEELPINGDSLDKKFIKEVPKLLEPNLISSFIFPGSVAENTDSPDPKTKINPNKVESVVIDGTTIPVSAGDGDIPYTDDPDLLDGVEKPVEPTQTESEKASKSAEVKVDLKSGEIENNTVANDSDAHVSSPVLDNDSRSPSYLPLNNIPQSLTEFEVKKEGPVATEASKVSDINQNDENLTTVKTKEDKAGENDSAAVKSGDAVDETEETEDDAVVDEEEDDDDDEEDEEEEEEEFEEVVTEKTADDGKVVIDSGDVLKKDSILSDNVGNDSTVIHANENVTDHVKIESSSDEKFVKLENVSELIQENKPADKTQPQETEKIEAQNIQPVVSETLKVSDDLSNQNVEILNNISGQVSGNLNKSSEMHSSDEVVKDFIYRPDVKSELVDKLQVKEPAQSGNEERIDKDINNEFSSKTTASGDLESGKVSQPSSTVEHAVDNNETKREVPGASPHVHSDILVPSDKITEDSKKVTEDSMAIQHVEVTEEFTTALPSTDAPEVIIKKDTDETVEHTVPSDTVTPSLPILPVMQPSVQDQIEISTQETVIEPPSSEEHRQEQLASEEEAVSVEEKPVSAEETLVDNIESESWFSFDFITNLFSSTSQPSQDTIDVSVPEGKPVDPGHSVWTEETDITSAQDQQYCSANENEENSCRHFQKLKEENLSSTDDKEDSWDVFKELLSASQGVTVSTDSLIYLIITAVTVILFSLGYYYIENHRNDNALVAKINQLERDLLVVKKEAAINCRQLQDKLQTAESQVSLSHCSLTELKEQLEALTQELEETKAAKLELEEQYVILEKEFDAATESGLEMHRLLTESLSTQDGSQVLLKTVESLREKLDHQDGEIKELKQLLSEKSEEIDKLHEEMKANQETRKALQEKLTALRREKEEEVLQLKDSNRTLSTQLGDLMEEKSLIEMKLSNDISKLRLLLEETQTTLANREGEIDALREAIAKLNKHDKEEDLEALYDTAKVSSKLSIVEKERDSYKEKFLEEEGARKLLEDHVQMTRQEVKSLKENYETAEKEKIEALTKLQVLSNYFKEKESQLQKELGLQESMWLQKQSDDHTIYEQMKSLREENEKYKLQNESLKKEICESESAFKIQIANAEQKAHDSWLASRQLERRLKETQNEATQLRNRLTLVEKNATNSSSDDLKQNMSYGIGETNGDPSSPPPTMPLFPPATSPPFMMFGGTMPPPPPPTSEFLPPPPPPPLGFPEGRPAPVGRISSPPLDHSFSPPPPLPYFYDSAVYGGHHSPSPPPHRPMPKPIREMGMEPKDRVSPPRHSEQQERTGRRSKR